MIAMLVTALLSVTMFVAGSGPVLASVIPSATMQSGASAAIDQEDQDKLTPLMRASARGDLQLVNALLKKRANPDVQGSGHRLTALMFASYFGHAGVVKALLATGAKVDLADASGAKAIDWAVVGEHQALVTLFAEKGAVLNPFLNVGIMPLSLMDRAAEKPK